MNDYSWLTTLDTPRDWLVDIARHAIASVHPSQLMAKWLPEAPKGKVLVVGAGKAAAAMAKSLEDVWDDRYPTSSISGLVVTRHGHAERCRQIEVLEASHPMPDDLGERAAQRMLESVQRLTHDDLVIALISGGGSSLMSLPGGELTLQQKQRINKALLRSGAPISEINTVRRHLSAIKGGRLAVAAHPARVITYLISDVPGDEPSLVASGPTLPDDSTPAEALSILEARKIDIPYSVRHHLVASADAPCRGDVGFHRDETVILAKAADALQAARRKAEEAGVEVKILGDDLEGEARQLGRTQGLLARHYQDAISRPLLLLSGGETSVTVKGSGRGGRNLEYLLGLFQALEGAPGIHALAVDTDGIDGSEDNAGAIISPQCWQRAREARLSIVDAMANNDAYTFFAALDALLVIGPTRTNVNDFRAILIEPLL